MVFGPALRGFTTDFKIEAEDWSLAISNTVEEVDPRILEIFTRFYEMNWLQDFGNQCFLITDVLRKILRIHGIEAHVREMITEYENTNRGWYQKVGDHEEITHAGTIDTHRVVVTKDYILDWAHRDSLYRPFGAMAPRGFIGDIRYIDSVQEIKPGVTVKWKPREIHPVSKNVQLYQRDDVRMTVREYFNNFLI